MPTADSLINAGSIRDLVRVLRDSERTGIGWSAVLASADGLSGSSH